MNHDLKYWLRWIAVLPGALLAAALITFPLHYILYFTLRNYADPYPPSPERILAPLAICACIIIAGNRIAPDKKNLTAMILFSLLLFLNGLFVFLILTDTPIHGMKFYFQLWGLPNIAACAGAAYGLYQARKTNRADEEFRKFLARSKE